MRRTASRRAAPPDPTARRRRRLIGAAGALVVFGGIIGVSQLSFADDDAAKTKNVQVNGLDVLSRNCDDSKLEEHDGFQKGDRCVTTEFGEVPVAANSATLLITKAPKSVKVGEAFTLKVSTRNLIRDRFLAAGQGGYYVESSILQDGIVRGHFHTACRILDRTDRAPDGAPAPAFFVATEDRKGGKTPDVVDINVPGLKDAGTFQCSSWAGDGSHRIPMMENAKQTPAVDSVRIKVEKADEQPPGDDNGGDNNGGDNNGGGGNNGGGDNNGGDNNGGGADNGDGGDQGNGGDQGGDQGGNNGGGADNGGDNGDGGDQGNNGGDDQGDYNQGGGGQVPPVKPGQPQTDSGTVTKPPTKPADKPTGKPADKPASKPTKESDEPADTAQNLSGGSKSDEPATGDKQDDDQTQADAAAAAGNDDDTTSGDQQQASADQQQAVADTKDDSKLALTGTNTLAIAAGGVALVLIGFAIFGFSRRRRPERHYYG